MGTVRCLAFEPPLVRVDTVLRLARYRDLTRVPAVIRDAAVAVVDESRRLATPQAMLWRGPITSREMPGTVTIGDAHRLHSTVLARMLVPCSEVVVFVLTAGPAIEQRTHALLADKELLEAFLMDTAAWATIEHVARTLRLQLRAEERAAGRSVTHRLAPGYCDWSLDEQMELFSVFGDRPLPVTLNEAACMLPRKSISGVFGIVTAR